jgi:hypothetical protein
MMKDVICVLVADDVIALGFIDQSLNVNEPAYHRLKEMTATLAQFGPSPRNTERA